MRHFSRLPIARCADKIARSDNIDFPRNDVADINLLRAVRAFSSASRVIEDYSSLSLPRRKNIMREKIPCETLIVTQIRALALRSG